ncbi:MAG TPA: condensation domain-containing protein, partial [Castellaniella sp.]|nr:condensation domain-containing protein [Castellaniella sp.]
MALFDLEAGPLVRGRLIQLSSSEHALLVTMHHIVSDGWSMGVLTRELGALYRAFSEGQPDPLPALEIQYADYAAWQRRRLDGDALRTQAEYWQRTLAGAPALLETPTDRPRPTQQDYAGAEVALELDESLTQDLKELSQRHGTTLFMTLLAGWATLLSRLAGQEEVVIGTPVANRTRAEVEPLIGFFVNTLALRLDLSNSPTVSEMLGRVKDQALAAQERQDLPFEQVVEIVKPPRSMAYSPLFQATFTWQNNETSELELPGLTLAPVSVPYIGAKHDLSLYLSEAGAGIVGALVYAATLFDRSTAERYGGYLRNVLTAMAADDEQAVERLPMLSQVERRQTLVEWNATQTEYQNNQLIHGLFETQAAQRPDAVAVAQEDYQLSYGELNVRANRLAHHLRRFGVRPDARVGLCVERSLEMVVGLLGILKAGGAYVPLDPTYPVERLTNMLEDSRPVAVLTHPQAPGPVYAALRLGAAGGRGAAPLIDLEADAESWARQADNNPDRDIVGLTPGHLAYVIYTSGSTGQPKGVMVGHRSLCNLAIAQIRDFGVEAESRVLQFASLSFDASVSEIAMTLCQGACLCLGAAGRALVGEAFKETIRRYGITHVTAPPAALAGVSEEGEAPSLGTLIVAGDMVTEAVVKEWGQGRRMLNAYGPTEATVCASMHECRTESIGRPPIGRPIGN